MVPRGRQSGQMSADRVASVDFCSIPDELGLSVIELGNILVRKRTLLVTLLLVRIAYMPSSVDDIVVPFGEVFYSVGIFSASLLLNILEMASEAHSRTVSSHLVSRCRHRLLKTTIYLKAELYLFLSQSKWLVHICIWLRSCEKTISFY